jgi:hypothetical protein
MTEDQKYEIAVLAEDYANKRLRFDCLAMANAHGKTAEEAMEQSIQYHMAEAEKWEAWARLQAAKAPARS